MSSVGWMRGRTIPDLALVCMGCVFYGGAGTAGEVTQYGNGAIGKMKAVVTVSELTGD